MLVLGIESTCDETAASVVKDSRLVLSNVIFSQSDMHSVYGGVVPELAARRHIEAIVPVIKEALEKASITLNEIDLIAAANGPGLIGAILIGLNAAKTLSIALKKPFIGVNHIEAHLYSAIMSEESEILFPAIGCLISGGHTALVIIETIGTYKLIGQTVDDAIGEAFDKAAKMLSLPYPGGPEIEKLAKSGDSSSFSFKAGHVKTNPFAFSFSGLKTALLYAWQKQKDEKSKADLAASFQKAAFDDLISKTLKAAKQFNCQTVLFGGGVANSRTLRAMFESKNTDLKAVWPAPMLSLDNAAMIAGLGCVQYQQQGFGDPLTKQAKAKIAFT